MRNSVAAAPTSRFRGDPMAAFDRLPAPVRRALWDGVINWDPRAAKRHLNKRLKAGRSESEAAEAEVKAIRRADQDEVELFAHCWPIRFGVYPHKAARVTILRSYEADGAASDE